MALGLTIEAIYTAAAVLLGFQGAAIYQRMAREIEVSKTDLTWIPPADILNLFSFVVTVTGVFILPLLFDSFQVAKAGFLLGVTLSVGYPFALLGHYDMLEVDKKRTMVWCTWQEFYAILCTLVVSVALFIIFVAIEVSR